MTGTVVKGIGGFYFVYDGSDVIMGKARGNLKRNKELIYVGDIVDFDIDQNDCDGECVINTVIERKNFLSRPPVSNLDMLVVVFSLVHPEVNYPVVDKLIAACEQKGIEPAICISKIDLADDDEIASAYDIYSPIFPTVKVNAVSGEGIDELESIISGRKVALAGPSGVGKSTISNHLLSDLGIVVETGDISDKTQRGRHTTRHVEIFALGDGTLLYDTPGFTSLELLETEPREIRELFREFKRLDHDCRYSDCMHINEPDCAIKEALEKAAISSSRYESYLLMTEEAEKWLK